MVMIDMDMPQSCEECPFGYVNYVTNFDGCELMDCLPNSPDCSAYTPIGQRDKNCPLREVPKGKWISLDDFRGKYNDYGFKCSECDEHIDYEASFCPNCGAYMGKENT